ncbi:hypothetical protein JS756_08765 [Streptomyces actuosus]|uniref:Lipoprotein n=1 Tax=Streptomyces actuosus TaxID=1885 RepID=A0ABS2VM64_STRAS|nr:hypothetical protein [Streptomyces actuosus]MBN0044198.1 hypothetical protein [Streptomyces actuosus]
MHRTLRTARSAVLAALMGTAVAACGTAQGGGGPSRALATVSATADDVAGHDEESGQSARQLIERANDTMRSLAFSGVGSTTSFDGGVTLIDWNPDRGLHMSYSATADDRQDMYCKDGLLYTSAPLLARSLGSQGVDITVPDRLRDVYVTKETGESCAIYFVIPSSGTYAPDKDTTVNGSRARAIEVRSSGTSSVYYVSADDPARILKLKSVHNGRTSSTAYSDFGKKQNFTLPGPDRTMTMEEFRGEVDGAHPADGQ